jgi:hypothetical protein
MTTSSIYCHSLADILDGSLMASDNIIAKNLGNTLNFILLLDYVFSKDNNGGVNVAAFFDRL